MSGPRRTPATALTPEEGRRIWLELYGPGAPYEVKHREAMERLRLRMPTIFGQERENTPVEATIAHRSTMPPYKP